MIDGSIFIAVFAITLVMILSIIVTCKIIQYRYLRRKTEKQNEEIMVLKNKIEMADVRALGAELKEGLSQLRQTQAQANEITKHLKEAKWR